MSQRQMRRDSFSNTHPFVHFYFFVYVLTATMFFFQPFFIGISFVCGVVYMIYLNGKKAVYFLFIGILPIFLMIAMIQPLFSHRGGTILFYFPNGNPGTLESILYGFTMAGMLVSVMVWFSCFHVVMTSDKLMYLFGKITPALSLTFSMTLRLVPRFKRQARAIAQAQQGIGKGVEKGNVIKRLKNGGVILSILVTWALENAIETATSMKSRGYGLKKRTSFSLFHFEKRDGILMVAWSVFSLILLVATLFHQTSMKFFPVLAMQQLSFATILLYVLFFLSLFMPMAINLWEDWKWTSIQSKE